MSRARAVLGLCAVGLMLAIPMSTAYAGGFSIYEQGARAMGRASAFAACPADPSAIFYNPAGLTLLDGTQIYVGATVIIPSGSFEGSNYFTGGVTVSHDQASQLFFPPNLYISHRVNEKIVLGLGVHTPFGLGTKWENPESFTGRYLAHETAIEGIAISPTVAFAVNDKLSVGVGAEVRLSKLVLKRYSSPVDLTAFGLTAAEDVAKANLDTDLANAFGFNVGVLFKATDQINIGVAYRSAVTVDYEGTATIEQVLTGNAVADAYIAAQPGFGDFNVKSSIAYPSVITAAVAYQFTDQFLVEADVNYFGWSAFEQLEVTGLPTGTETIDEDYEDAMEFRVGCEYWKSEDMALRAGFVYDVTPVPPKSISPLLPDASRMGVTAGIGKSFGNVTIDAAFMYLMFADADTEGKHTLGYNGIYKNRGLLFGLNIGYALGR